MLLLALVCSFSGSYIGLSLDGLGALTLWAKPTRSPAVPSLKISVNGDLVLFLGLFSISD